MHDGQMHDQNHAQTILWQVGNAQINVQPKKQVHKYHERVG